MKLNKGNLTILLGFLISGVCLWVFLRNIHWESLRVAFAQASYLYMLPMIVISVFIYVLRALRWGSLVSSLKRASFKNLFSATMLGFMANHILPARAGEIIKPIVLGKKENIKLPAVFATVVVERILDIISLLVFSVALLAFLPYLLPQGMASGNQASHLMEHSNIIVELKKWAHSLMVLGAGLTVFLLLLIFYPEKVSSNLMKILFFVPQGLRGKLEGIFEPFTQGLKVIRSLKHFAWLMGLSLLMWIISAAGLYSLSFSFKMELPFCGACLVIVCIALAVASPQAPGYIGVFHIVTQKSLEVFNVDLGSAQSYAIVSWAICYFVPIIGGTFFLWKEGLTFYSLFGKETEVSEVIHHSHRS